MREPEGSGTTSPLSDGVMLGSVVRAFLDDPLYRWLVPDIAKRADALAQLFAFTLQRAEQVGSVDVDPDRQAVAAWTAAGRELLDDPTPFVELLDRWAPGQRDAALTGMAATDAATPTETRILHLLAVDPEAQGRGIGRQLIAARLATADRTGETTALTTSQPRNVGFYARLGFQQHAAVPLPQGGPTMFVLVRPAPR